MPSARRAVATLLAAVALSLASGEGVARAEPSAAELADARRIFNEGKDLEKAGNYAAALDKFKKVAEVRVTPQVRFHIALCEENLGKLVSAMKGFELAAEEARQAGSSAIEVAENAPARAAALKKRVAHLKINVTGRIVTSRVTLDGAPLTKERFGADQLVDPGKHRVILETEGAPVFDKDLDLKEGESQAISVEAHDKEPEDGGTPPVGQPAIVPPPSRTPAYVVGGLGVAGLAGAGVLFGLSRAELAKAENTCPSHQKCPEATRSHADNGRTFYTSSLVVGGVGAAALATGAVLFVVLAPKKPKPTTGPALQVSPTLGGASLRVRF